ncbi:MAG: isoaspartyl peptidase/L-asparaginase [Myxococcota bacterium]
MPVRPLVVVHAGAGNVRPDRRTRHLAGCRAAARHGLERLVDGEGALDAVQRAVDHMEADPDLNAAWAARAG